MRRDLGSWMGGLFLLTATSSCGEPRRDPDYPQYTQPRWETLAWRRVTDQPSPELSTVPAPHHEDDTLAAGPSPSNSAAAAPDAGAASACRLVTPSRACARSTAFACGIFTPDSHPTAEPPIETLFFVASRAEAERMALDARSRGAMPLPTRSCRFQSFDACSFVADLACTDEHGGTSLRAQVKL